METERILSYVIVSVLLSSNCEWPNHRGQVGKTILLLSMIREANLCMLSNADGSALPACKKMKRQNVVFPLSNFLLAFQLFDGLAIFVGIRYVSWTNISIRIKHFNFKKYSAETITFDSQPDVVISNRILFHFAKFEDRARVWHRRKRHWIRWQTFHKSQYIWCAHSCLSVNEENTPN